MIKLGRITLVEINKDFTLKIPSSSHQGRYKRIRTLKLDVDEVKISKRVFKKRVKELMKKYPNIPFKFREVNGFLVFSRSKGLSLYYSPKLKKIFVPISFIKYKRKELRKGLPYRLNTLGIPFKLL